MQIIIDIAQDCYELVKHNVDNYGQDFLLYKLIAKGKPLKKGHGDIADLDDVRRVFTDAILEEANEIGIIRATSHEIGTIINNIPVILEADWED